MSEATVGQAYEVLALLANRIEKWRPGLDKDCLQEEVIKDPERVAAQFAQFLKNGARAVIVFVVSFVLKLVSTFNPAEFINKDWLVWKGPANGDGKSGDEDRDVREDALSEIDWSKVDFDDCLEEGESSITGEEKLCRMKESGKILLGGRAFLTLWQDYQKNGEASVLEQLRKTQGITYVDFFGLVLRDPDGNRCVLYLFFDGEQWRWNYYWLRFGWSRRNRSASLASV